MTEYDIMKMLAGTESELTVDEIMTKNPKVVAPDVPINYATRQMVDHDYRRLRPISWDTSDTVGSSPIWRQDLLMKSSTCRCGIS